MIRYTDSIDGITADILEGFFQGWPNPPSKETHLQILKNSAFVVLAVDEQTNRVVGFINAISDHVLCAYIPLLEVLPTCQGQGIGKELMKRMLDKLQEFYMVGLTCDPELEPFYKACGMSPTKGMSFRHYHRQSGKTT